MTNEEFKNKIINIESYNDYINIIKEANQTNYLDENREFFVKEILYKIPCLAYLFDIENFNDEEKAILFLQSEKDFVKGQSSYIKSIKNKPATDEWAKKIKQYKNALINIKEIVLHKETEVEKNIYIKIKNNIEKLHDLNMFLSYFIDILSENEIDIIYNIKDNMDKSNFYTYKYIVKRLYVKNKLNNIQIGELLNGEKSFLYYSDLNDNDKEYYLEDVLIKSPFNYKRVPEHLREDCEYLIDFNENPLLSEFIINKESKDSYFWKKLIQRDSRVIRFVPKGMLKNPEIFSDDYLLNLFKMNISKSFNSLRSKYKIVRFVFERAEERFSLDFYKKLEDNNIPVLHQSIHREKIKELSKIIK